MNKKDIKVACWLKNGTEWYYPVKTIDLSEYDHVQLLIKDDHSGDIYIAWNGDSDAQKHATGRLFKSK